MKALFVVVSVLLFTNCAVAESPTFAAIREVVTDAIQECRSNRVEHTLGDVLQALAPEIEALKPVTQADRDTLEELRLALDHYKDCL